MLEKRNFYIDGKWIAPSAPADYDVTNPSTEEVCAVISLGEKADTNKAVAAARRAFGKWSATSRQDRLALLETFLQVYKKRSGDMAQAISLEMGAPIDMAREQQAGVAVWHSTHFIEALRSFEFERVWRKDAPQYRILMEPIGVCAMITPWNWPMNQITLKCVPALAVGCTMVLKPSELSPLSAMVFAEIIDEAGFPAGVFNLVNGDGEGVGTQLSAHSDVDMVSFTGSTRAGTAISKVAADTHKRVSLEMGGKGANLIFTDADKDAVTRGVMQCFGNSGQSCNAPTRMLVERPMYDAAVEMARLVAESTKTGPSSDSGDHLGPVVSETQFNKVQNLIEKGVSEGARLVVGGTGRPDGLNRGYFVRPTVFADVNNDMIIAREEIFGPVLSIIPFDTEEEAVEIANDTVYGLTNYVQTGDRDRASRVTRQLRSGMVELNGEGRCEGSPFGGYKQSGNGREGGIWGLEEFLEVKSVSGWAGGPRPQ